MSRSHAKLHELLQPTVDSLGCELWGVEYHPRKHSSLLRVFVEREGGVTVEDCERVSHQISGLLDVEDPIPGEYVLEVSSPGLDRLLFDRSHFERFVGSQVDVRLDRKLEGRRRFQGRLTAVEGDDVSLELEGESVSLPLEAIDKARVVPEF